MDQADISSAHQSAALGRLADDQPVVLDLESSSLAFSPQIGAPVSEGLGARLLKKIQAGKFNFSSATEIFFRTV